MNALKGSLVSIFILAAVLVARSPASPTSVRSSPFDMACARAGAANGVAAGVAVKPGEQVGLTGITTLYCQHGVFVSSWTQSQ